MMVLLPNQKENDLRRRPRSYQLVRQPAKKLKIFNTILWCVIEWNISEIRLERILTGATPILQQPNQIQTIIRALSKTYEKFVGF
jgi:hypothetical protein